MIKPPFFRFIAGSTLKWQIAQIRGISPLQKRQYENHQE